MAFLIQNAFNGGEWSKLLEGRSDLDKYSKACYAIENMIIDAHGPAKRRPGWRYIATAKGQCYLIPFDFGAEQSYILEFGDYYIRFYKDQEQILDGASPYEIVSPYAIADIPTIDSFQSYDVLYLRHSGYAPRKLVRVGDTDWILSIINYNPPATKEQGHELNANLTLSALTGDSITVTASTSVFLNGDINRLITSGVGKMSIVSYTSGTQVTCDVIDDFASLTIASGDWTLQGTTTGFVLPSIKSPVGGICTITSSAGGGSTTYNLFRSADVGKYIRVYGGMVKINTFTSATSVKGPLIKELTSVEDGESITYTSNFTIESEVWTTENGYPSRGCFFDDRLCEAASPEYPDTVWMSVVGDYENFTPGIDDSDSAQFALGSRKVSIIRWLMPDVNLMIGTMDKVWRAGAENADDPITPLNIGAKIQNSTRGCENITPVQADKSILYVQRHGRKIRELAYAWEEEKYVSPDMTLLAEHITKDTISGMAYQEEPDSILWTYMETGTLKALTYLRSEEVVGWHSHPMDDCIVESLAVKPGDGYDELWAVMLRTVNGIEMRTVEVMAKLFNDDKETFTANKGLNAFFVDCGGTYNGVATTTIPAAYLPEGTQVQVLADGAYLSRQVTSGQITLPKAAEVVHYGLGYVSKMIPMKLKTEMNNGTSESREAKIHNVNIKVIDSGPFKVGRDMDHLDNVYDKERTIIMGAPYELFTGDIQTGYDDNWTNEGRITIVQDKPLPLTVAAIVYEVDIN